MLHWIFACQLSSSCKQVDISELKPNQVEYEYFNYLFCVFCRYLCEDHPDVTQRRGDRTQQDVCPPRPAEPPVQGDIYVPGSYVPAA